MAAYDARVIHRTLVTKLQADHSEGGRHATYRVFDDAGVLVARTHMSRGARDIGEALMSAIARELHVEPGFWRELYACSHDRAEFLRRLPPQ